MKKYLPHLIAVVVFILIAFIYCAPVFSGKELRQSDINNWKGMSKEIVDFSEKSGENTMWTNSMFGGMPAYQISAVYVGNLIQYLDKVFTLWLPTPLSYIFLLMAGFYFLLITMKVESSISILGAVAFAFGTYFLLFMVTGHNSKVHALGYMAPVIAGVILTYRGRILAGTAITAVALALELFANHLQITYYLMLIVVILVITELYKAVNEKRIGDFVKASAMLGIAALLAVSSNVTNLWATQEYGKYSTRGPSELTANKENQTTGLDRDYITDWSYGIGESLTLLIPDFKGGASEPIGKNNKDALKEVDNVFRQNVSSFGAYFGDQPFTGGPLYVGAVIILLFVIGVFVVRGPVKWWLVSATALSLMLSWGHNFMSFTNLFLDYVPGYDKFRAVTTTLVIAQFAIPLLAILALVKMVNEKDFLQKNKKRLFYSGGTILALTFLIAVSPGTFTDFKTEREVEQVMQSVKDQQNPRELVDNFFDSVSKAREHIVQSDAIRSFMFMIIAAIVIFTFLRFRYKKEYFIYGLLVLVMFDLVSVDRRYLASDDFVKKSANVVPFPMTHADQFIKQDTTQSYRVLNLTANIFNDASTSYYHQSIGGYHGAKLKRYKELIDYSLTREVSALSSAFQKQDSTRELIMYSQPALNMLNAKYFIYNPDAPPLQNKGALGNAWFVSAIKFVPNSDSEVVSVNSFNPATTVLVDDRYKDKLSGFTANADPNAVIQLTNYKPNHLIYKTSAASEQLAVFSEIYYDKGWIAMIDGKTTDYFRADYVLRSMRIPAGDHTVEFKFEPEVVSIGEKISFAGSALILLFAAFAAWSEFKRKRSVTTDHS